MQHSKALRYCEVCNGRIPPERLRLLPGTRRCVRCSTERPYTEEDVPVDGADVTEQLKSFDGPSTGQARW